MFDDEIKKNKNRKDALRQMLDMMIEVTNDPKIIFKRQEIKLIDKLDLIALNMRNVTDVQYKELINIVEQFYKVIDDYVTSNKINLTEI